MTEKETIGQRAHGRGAEELVGPCDCSARICCCSSRMNHLAKQLCGRKSKIVGHLRCSDGPIVTPPSQGGRIYLEPPWPSPFASRCRDPTAMCGIFAAMVSLLHLYQLCAVQILR